MRFESSVRFNATHLIKTIPPIPTVLNHVGVRESTERQTQTTIAESVPLPVAMATFSLRQYLFKNTLLCINFTVGL